MIDHGSTIKTYHWVLALSVAMLLHILLLINIKQDNDHHQNHTVIENSEVIIGLKKLKPPPIIQPRVVESIVETPVRIKPDKPTPTIKKQTPIKPKPKQKPINKSKSVLAKPTIVPPQVAALNTTTDIVEEKNQTEIQPPKSVQTVSSSFADEKKKSIYYEKLSQWLERHKKYPTVARRRNQQGDVTIKFVMDRQGKLLRYDLIGPSEYQSLNDATVKMLERASPMPTPPPTLIGDKTELEYTIPVKFSLLK